MKLNFDGVESGFPRPSEGDHIFMISGIKEEDSKAKDSTNVVVDSEVVEGSEDDGKKVRTYFSQKEGALWNWKLFLEAVNGGPLPEGDFELDLEDLVGKTFKATVEHNDPYANLTGYESV